MLGDMSTCENLRWKYGLKRFMQKI